MTEGELLIDLSRTALKGAGIGALIWMSTLMRPTGSEPPGLLVFVVAGVVLTVTLRLLVRIRQRGAVADYVSWIAASTAALAIALLPDIVSDGKTIENIIFLLIAGVFVGLTFATIARRMVTP